MCEKEISIFGLYFQGKSDAFGGQTQRLANHILSQTHVREVVLSGARMEDKMLVLKSHNSN